MTMPNQSKCRTAIFLLLKHVFRGSKLDWSRWDDEWIAYATVTIPSTNQFQLYGDQVDYIIRLEALINEDEPGEEPTGQIFVWFEVDQNGDHDRRPLWNRKIMTFKVADLLKNPLDLGSQAEAEVGSLFNTYGGWLDHKLWELTK